MQACSVQQEDWEHQRVATKEWLAKVPLPLGGIIEGVFQTSSPIPHEDYTSAADGDLWFDNRHT